MRIIVFLHGTSIMHSAAADVGREERVRQVRERHPSIRDYSSYVPTPGTVQKLAEWRRRGATLEYFSSHRQPDHIAADEEVLRTHDFPSGPVYARSVAESYGAAVERLLPDLVIEDDCESIGGAPQTIAAQLSPAVRRAVVCVVLQEFAGFEELPDDPGELLRSCDSCPE